jgi:hypothetical protein
MMKRLCILTVALLVSTYSFASHDSEQLTSAIQSGFNNPSSYPVPLMSVIYSGKDISRPKIAVADERTFTVQPRIIG